MNKTLEILCALMKFFCYILAVAIMIAGGVAGFELVRVGLWHEQAGMSGGKFIILMGVSVFGMIAVCGREIVRSLYPKTNREA